MRNPFTGYPVSNEWTSDHQAVDYATPIGTEFTAPADGTYRHRPSETARVPGAAGVYGDLCLDDGRRIRFCHLDHHIAPDGARVTENATVLATTGNTGYVLPTPTAANPTAGAHVHTTGFDASGVRWNWTTETTPIEGEEMRDDERNALMSMYQATFVGGGDAGDKSIIARLIDLEDRPIGTTEPIDYDKLAKALLRAAAKQ